MNQATSMTSANSMNAGPRWLIGRRRFLSLAAGTAVMAACSSGDDDSAEQSSVDADQSDNTDTTSQTDSDQTGTNQSELDDVNESINDSGAVGGRFTPTGAIVTRWRQDPFAFGSYSYLATGSTSDDRKVLRDTVDDRLYFAGEATSEDFPGTVHGALLEGREAADRIADEADDGETVIVIGAGAAGLGAADQLQRDGYRVVVIEGRDRIGGRVHSDDRLGVTVDLGAGWIHGVTNNPLTDLADDNGVARVPTDYDNITVYDVDGSEADEDLIEELEEALGDIDADSDLSVSDALSADLAELDDREVRYAQYVLTASVEHEFAADVGDLSSAALDEGEEYKGGDVMFPGGYVSVLAPLAAALDIRLEQTVNAIVYGDDGIEIGLSDGTTIEGGYVVLTVPLGVLKAGVIDFAPPLPAEKQAAIERLGMGVLDRVVLQFDEVFWDDDLDLIGCLGIEPGLFVEWVNLVPIVGAPMLAGFNAGSSAERIESLSDDEVIALAVDTLRSIYG